jgi:nitroreductase
MIQKGNLTIRELNLSRRAINHYNKDLELDMVLVKRIISDSFQAPSTYNLQPWKLIMVKSAEAKEKLYNLSYKQAKILEAPLTLIIIGDKEGYNSDNSMWKEPFEKNGEEATNKLIENVKELYGKTEKSKLKFAESHGGLLAMNLMYLFKGNGIDASPMSGIEFEKIKKEFNLKETEEVVMLLAIGYQDESISLATKRRRKAYEEVVTEL